VKFIKKVEIKYFRSFSDKVVKIEYLNDLNIFSWWNDSWKSNVLRALNIFFKNEVSHWIPFDFDRDFSKIQKLNSKYKYDIKKEKNADKEYRRSDQFIEVKCHFDLSEKSYWNVLPKKFWISRRWTRTKSWELNHNINTIYKKENEELLKKLWEWTNQYANKFNSLKQSITKFLNKIDYFYVPAIKDYAFFKDLYSILQQKLTEVSWNKIEDSKKELQKVIKEETQTFFNKFKKSTDLDAWFLIEQKLLDFKKNIEVETWNDILLTSRWDWVQARLIPDILDELTDKHKYIFWWFEEPENSYEYKHSKKLADEFYDKYSIDKQIFITTHSKEFLWISDPIDTLKKDKKVSIYRVFKWLKWWSKIERYEDEKWFSKENIKKQFLWDSSKEENLTDEQKDVLQNIYDDLWIIDESKIITELEEEIFKMNLEKNDLEKFKNEAKEKLKELGNLKKENQKISLELGKAKENNKISIFCENKNADDLNKLWFKSINFVPSSTKIYAFDTAKQKNDNIFALIDRDFLTDEEKECIEYNTNVRLFDFYCFENYLYHPENLKEYYINKNEEFDTTQYIEKILKEFEKFQIVNIWSSRRSYKEISDFCKKKLKVKSIDTLIFNKMDNFNDIYKYFSMKDNCNNFIEKNINKPSLIETSWFKNKIKEHLKSMWINIE